MEIKTIEDDFKVKLDSYINKWDSDSRILHLFEEVGEFAEIILHYKGIKSPKKDLYDIKVALADIIEDVYAISILNNITLEELTSQVLKKNE
ncbi:MAG: MazG nucleotide pyrophosphohydrolase domain-containing protein [Candidatus Pacebacteria bacterium]|nr:MazG nucleotide pyrophosphohydrolase domain-containing protein [Candidatus Paceibacterota bacterium]